MKRQLLFLVMALLTVANTFAVDVFIGDLYYSLITETKEAKVIKYKNNKYPYRGEIIIPETVTYEEVDYCVTSIDEWSFYNCKGVTSVTIGNNVESIGNSAFNGCTGITSVTIGNKVESIGSSVFDGCKSITSIILPNSVTAIESSAFSGCSGLRSVTIPNSVTSIGASAFYGCSNLRSITIPNSVTSIESGLFSYCSALSSVTIPFSVTSIKDGAFCGCTCLTSITIPYSVTSIGEYAFRYCNLTSITIPPSVTSIGNYAFADCNILMDVISKIKTPFYLGKNTFSENTLNNATLYVPKGTIEKYKELTVWNKFKYFEEINNDDEAAVAEVKAMPVLIQANDGVLNISGAPEGADIRLYDTSGRPLGTTTATSGTTKIAVPATDKIAIVKIGDKAVKVSLK